MTSFLRSGVYGMCVLNRLRLLQLSARANAKPMDMCDGHAIGCVWDRSAAERATTTAWTLIALRALLR